MTYQGPNHLCALRVFRTYTEADIRGARGGQTNEPGWNVCSRSRSGNLGSLSEGGFLNQSRLQHYCHVKSTNDKRSTMSLDGTLKLNRQNPLAAFVGTIFVCGVLTISATALWIFELN